MPKIKYLKDSPNANKGDVKEINEPFARALVKLKRATYFLSDDVEDDIDKQIDKKPKKNNGKYKTKVVKPGE